MSHRCFVILCLTLTPLLGGCKKEKVMAKVEAMVKEMREKMQAEAKKMMDELVARLPAIIDAVMKKQEEKSRALMDEFITKIVVMMSNPSLRGSIGKIIGGSIAEAVTQNPAVSSALSSPGSVRNIVAGVNRAIDGSLAQRYRGALGQELQGVRSQVAGLFHESPATRPVGSSRVLSSPAAVSPSLSTLAGKGRGAVSEFSYRNAGPAVTGPGLKRATASTLEDNPQILVLDGAD